jgi:hypothetical protein
MSQFPGSASQVSLILQAGPRKQGAYSFNESALHHLSENKQVGTGHRSCGPTAVALVVSQAKTPA